ncbi:glycosyltransferase [Candidatus Jettenia caeni]|uniref:Glycosyltransferase n=1 Tax=Candidatus Jettenia caeni TaxID=247490 RepID=I3IQ11_9BACT|nr:glycosyltransferase [Candidatus Jettenia sp. AMX1]MCQ3928010.1 glycosyltransferase [Candidatus Jettenia sp.]WKZ15126.1 MAG: glycosyltransferase [Candidatus Jettenia caeni]KAA0247227.1 MAG: glycosyltransferase [Candidatus Jettenia sp. AMX1]MCE7881454.1 glycosyltransferase [Candidatus Jettenia sp. AMX1]MDL1940509.1 glycosyltransferase [Candidatus Jettenia sp. AMX1]
MTISVSVILPTFRRDELLQRCLTSLFAQEYESSSYEIIVVDDARRQETQKLVEREKTRRGFPSLRYIPAGNTHGPAAARNCGWRVAAGDIVAFTDDDCIPSSTWLKAGVAAFTKGVVGVSGKIIVPIPSVPTDYEYTVSRLEHSEFVTANCFYLRDVIRLAGGFDEKYTAAWREDADLFFTLLKKNVKLVYAREAVVIHPVRYAPWGISLREHKKCMFNALLYKKHPVLYRQRIQQLPPWDYYSIVCASILLPFSVIYNLEYVTMGLLGVWILMTGRFFFKRVRKTSRSFIHIAEMAVTSVVIPFLAVFWRVYGAIKFRVFFL